MQSDEEMLAADPMQQPWDEEEDDDVAPLMAPGEDDSSALRRRRRERLKSLEIALNSEEEPSTSCLGDSWRLVASLLLGGLMAAPLLLKHFQSGAIPDFPSDRLPCAASNQVSFSESWKKISRASSFCSEVRYTRYYC